jgi:hypothetical protein
VRGAIEQFGDVDRDEVVDGGQLALRQPFERGERRLDPALRPNDVADHFFSLLVAQVKRGQHLEVGPHRGQRRTQFMGGDRGEVASRLERCPGALLFVTDPGEHALDGLGDFHSLLHAAHLHLIGFGLGVDGARLLGQHPERVDHDQPHHPAHQDGADDHAATDQQHPPVEFVDALLRFGQRRAHGDRRHTGGKGSDAVLDAVDRGVRVAVVELRQHDVARYGDGGPPDAGGTDQAAVRGGLIGGVVLGGAQKEGADVTQAAHRVQPSVQLAVLVVGHPKPHPRAKRDHQHNHGQRRDDDDDSQ